VVRAALRAVVAAVGVVALTACRPGSSGKAPAPAASRAPTAEATPTPAAEGSPGPLILQSPPAPLSGPAFFPPADRVPRLRRGAILPAAVEALEHGGTYWAVYLVAAAAGPDGDDPPGLEAAVDRIRASGVPIGAYGGFCDQGGEEALAAFGRVDTAVALYFETEAAARQFADQLDPAPIGIAKVTTLCLD
jgi:hypothetical protein